MALLERRGIKVATAIIEVIVGFTNLTNLTVDLFPLNSNTAAVSGLVLSEQSNSKGIYRTSTTAGLTGIHTVRVIDNGSHWYVAGYVYMDDTASVHQVVDYIPNSIDGNLATGIIDSLNAETYDGVAFQNIMKILLSMAQGRIVENPTGTFTFYQQDNTTPLFVLNKTGNERTRN